MAGNLLFDLADCLLQPPEGHCGPPHLDKTPFKKKYCMFLAKSTTQSIIYFVFFDPNHCRKLDIIVPACHPGSEKAEVGGSEVQGHCFSTSQVQGLPGL